jgi:succinylglutamate desuccinylase
MNYKNILLIGGTHGDERTGVDLVKYFENNPPQYIKTLIANITAVKENVRFMETDMNRSVGKIIPISYEEVLVKQLEPVIKQSELVIEFHNTTASNNTCGIVTTKPNRLHYSLADYFGLSRILIMPAKGSLSGISSKKFFSLEISNDDVNFTSIQNLQSKIKGLLRFKIIPNKNVGEYKFTGITVSRVTLKRLKLSLSDIKNFQAFTKKQATLLQLPKVVKFCPIFIGEKAYGEKFGFHIAEIA